MQNHPAVLGISGAANIGPSVVVRFCAVRNCTVLREMRRKLRNYQDKLRSFQKRQYLSRPCGIGLGLKLRTPFRFVFAHSAIAQCGDKCAVPSRLFLSSRLPSSPVFAGKSCQLGCISIVGTINAAWMADHHRQHSWVSRLTPSSTRLSTKSGRVTVTHPPSWFV